MPTLKMAINLTIAHNLIFPIIHGLFTSIEETSCFKLSTDCTLLHAK